METIGNIVVRVAKLGDDVDLGDWDALPLASRQYLARYGATQSLGDAAASVSRKNFPAGEEGDTEFLVAVEDLVWKRRDQILTGDVPGSRAPTDPNKVGVRAAANINRMDDATFAALKAAIEARENAKAA